MKTTQEIVLFSPVFCPTIGGRFNPPDGAKSDNNPIENKLKEIYPHLWTGYAREIIVSDRTRVIFYGLLGNSVMEYYSSYAVDER